MERVKSWWVAIEIYRQKNIVSMLFLGFSSGLPLALTFSVLGLWLKEDGLSLGEVVQFSLLGLPYLFKFAWAPLIDRMSLPFLTARLGQRRGWMILSQAMVMTAIVALGLFASASTPVLTALIALSLTFSSATQDIVIDAFRIDSLTDEEQAAGAGMAIYGYRIAMLVSGGGSLILADIMAWTMVYFIMGSLMVIGMITCLLVKEPDSTEKQAVNDQEAALIEKFHQNFSMRFSRFLAWGQTAVATPFQSFMTKKAWVVILLTIVLFKLGDALAGVITNLFLVDALGFTKTQVGTIVKGFGLVATLSGIALGGVLLSRIGMFRALVLTGVLQLLSNGLFIAQYHMGADVLFLHVTIGAENFTGGMGTVVFVAYLSALCNKAFSATQYALMSALSAVPRVFLSANAGHWVESLGWVNFFTLTIFAAVPGILLLFYLRKYNMGISHQFSGKT
ncbi:MAG: MFS transporter [Alphaproteobacteria bacterium]|nr:MAG: MFS transporter [Alphaproteobacteria bacterium]